MVLSQRSCTSGLPVSISIASATPPAIKVSAAATAAGQARRFLSRLAVLSFMSRSRLIRCSEAHFPELEKAHPPHKVGGRGGTEGARGSCGRGLLHAFEE